MKSDTLKCMNLILFAWDNGIRHNTVGRFNVNARTCGKLEGIMVIYVIPVHVAVMRMSTPSNVRRVLLQQWGTVRPNEGHELRHHLPALEGHDDGADLNDLGLERLPGAGRPFEVHDQDVAFAVYFLNKERLERGTGSFFSRPTSLPVYKTYFRSTIKLCLGRFESHLSPTRTGTEEPR